jgi:NADP-dependent aldehyde dehydrogenase
MTSTVSSTEIIAARAAAAALLFAATDPRDRALALVAVGDALSGAADELVAVAMAETGLADARLRGELRRTVVQLRLFADVVVDGSYLDARIDRPDDAFALGSRPDLRRTLVPLGPVLNFAASNFPFAFSVAGGDTAAALAAGCPVILKAHPGHPELSVRTGDLVSDALTAAGMPEHTFQLATGVDAGVELLRDDRVRAASFTGSTRGGAFLAEIAASRPNPIPFYGELGSVNPVFVTPAAIAERADAIARQFVASVSGSAGQLCTKPGFLFVPAGSGVEAAIAEAAAGVAPQRMLGQAISEGYGRRRDTVLRTPGVDVIVRGSLETDEHGQGWATPTFVRTTVAALEAAGDDVLDESFGPLSVVVEYDDTAALPGVVHELFPGNLTGAVHLAAGEESADVADVAAALAETSGRVLFDEWPTGVAVSPAMNHGGPRPATTSDAGTSVGTAAIARFLRAVSYQNAPQWLLPTQLRDENPWQTPRAVSRAGESATWGDRARR